MKRVCQSLLWKSAGMTVVARKVLVDGVEMEESVPLRIQFLKLRAAALGENGVTRIAVAGLDALHAICALVLAIMAPKASCRVFVTDIVGIGPPVGFHFGKEIMAVDSLS